MSAANEIDRDAPLSAFEVAMFFLLVLFVIVCIGLCCGCRTYYENVGMRVRAGNVTAPIEVSEPTSSANIRFLFFLNGVDLYVAKGYGVELDYAAHSDGTWLTAATTQAVHVAVSPTNAVEVLRE